MSEKEEENFLFLFRTRVRTKGGQWVGGTGRSLEGESEIYICIQYTCTQLRDGWVGGGGWDQTRIGGGGGAMGGGVTAVGPWGWVGWGWDEFAEGSEAFPPGGASSGALDPGSTKRRVGP